MKGSQFAFILLWSVVAADDNSTGWMLFPNDDGVPQIISLDDSVNLANEDYSSSIKFELYTKSSPSSYKSLILGDDESLANFDTSLSTKMYIHGWMSSASKGEFIKNDYLSVGDYNVILVDWSKMADDLYTSAKGNVKNVGGYVASLLDYLKTTKSLDFSTVHIVGHSLGAHVAGVVGNRVSGTIGKITGLDPAAPLFGSDTLQNILDKSDASFVEAIHTCAGVLGWADPLGHADFFPNGGGQFQPGCGLDLGGACSHTRSHDYFGESITTSVGFVGHKCDSWDSYQKGNCDNNPTALMGEYTDTSASGSYYLKTASSSPYALGA